MDWLRYYTDSIDNQKIQQLPGYLFKFWVNILCLARIHGGTVPPVENVAFRLRIPLSSNGAKNESSGRDNGELLPQATECNASSLLEELVSRHLLDRTRGGILIPHDWETYQYQSDSSTDRSRKFREKRRGALHTEEATLRGRCSNAIEVDTDTDTEQNRTETHIAPCGAAGVPGKLDDAAFLKGIGWPPKDGWKFIRKATPDQIRMISDLKETQIQDSGDLNSLMMIFARLTWFETFWGAYWRKSDLKGGRIAYFEAVFERTLHDRIIEAVDAQAPSMLAKEAQYRPLAATWIHHERWNDAVERSLLEEA